MSSQGGQLETRLRGILSAVQPAVIAGLAGDRSEVMRSCWPVGALSESNSPCWRCVAFLWPLLNCTLPAPEGEFFDAGACTPEA